MCRFRCVAIPLLTLHLLACGGAQSETKPHNSGGGATSTGGMKAQLASSKETSTVSRGGTSGTSVVSSGGTENAGGSAGLGSAHSTGGTNNTVASTIEGGSATVTFVPTVTGS